MAAVRNPVSDKGVVDREMRQRSMRNDHYEHQRERAVHVCVYARKRERERIIYISDAFRGLGVCGCVCDGRV